MPGPLVVCWGELLFDLFPDGPRLGGAAANAAYHLAQLGAQSVLVSRVGDDELGREAVAFLEQSGVDVSHVQRDDEHPTGTVHVAVVDGEPRYRIAEAAAWDEIQLGRSLERRLESADAVCYGTLAQRTVLGTSTLRRALSVTRPNAHRVCDLNLRPPHVTDSVLRSALERASVVKLNDQELEHVAPLLGTRDVPGALLKRGIAMVALTHAERGAELFTPDGHFRAGGVRIDTSRGDPVGAGDAFSACLALGLCRGTKPETLLDRANRYAAFVASERGGMPSVPPDVLESVAETSR
jgi:fructokinase